MDGGAGIGGGSSARDGFEDFDGGRGGEGVRRAVDTGLASSNSSGLRLCGVEINERSDWNVLLSPDARLRCESKLIDEESNAPKSSLRGSDERRWGVDGDAPNEGVKLDGGGNNGAKGAGFVDADGGGGSEKDELAPPTAGADD